MPPLAALARWAVAAALVSACAGGPDPTSTHGDPWSYCRAVGTIDAPDARYTGEPMPRSIAAGLRAAMGGPPDAFEVFSRGASWRCMDGKVYACAVGANLPCQSRADTSRAPSGPVAEFCRQNPSADVVPAYVTGRATVYEWRCANGAPVIARQVFTPDPRGFITNIWHELPPSPS